MVFTQSVIRSIRNDSSNTISSWEKTRITNWVARSCFRSTFLFRHSEEFFRSYSDYFQSTLNGDNGETVQYWDRYLEMMHIQTMIHTAIQENNLEMWLQAWTYWILFSFFFFSINFRTFYLETLKNIHKNYPGLKELLGTTGSSGQYQDRYAHRTAIDQCDKQIIDRDAKTSGKILFSLCMFWINLYNTLRFVMSLCFAFFA